MLIESRLFIDHKGKLQMDLEKRFQWTKTIHPNIDYTWRQDPELDSEYEISLMYQRQWNWSAGLMYTGSSVGVGVQYQF